MRITYINHKKPRQKGSVVLPIKAVADAIVALKARGFTITAVK